MPTTPAPNPILLPPKINLTDHLLLLTHQKTPIHNLNLPLSVQQPAHLHTRHVALHVRALTQLDVHDAGVDARD